MEIISKKSLTKMFACEICDYLTSKNSDYKKHVLTSKHLHGNKSDIIGNEKVSKENICTTCNKKYITVSGLWKHSKICKKNIVKEEENITVISENVQIYDTSSGEIKILTNLIMEMVKSNTELQKQNNELQKQVLDVCSKIQPTNINSNNNNNSNNKTFNLNFFLNEECKDAMNISDFVNTFDLQLDDLESVGKLGYVEGITKQIIDKLNSMDIYKRPMHCSDAKRETIYIKDDNKWEKEERGTPKLRKVIKNLSFNNMKLIAKWSDTYPDSKSSESRLNDKYMKLVKQTTGGNGELSENEDKIIRRIAKEIIIDKL